MLELSLECTPQIIAVNYTQDALVLNVMKSFLCKLKLFTESRGINKVVLFIKGSFIYQSKYTSITLLSICRLL